LNSDKYIGMDVHQTTTVVAVLDAEGKVVLETIVATGSGGNHPVVARLGRARYGLRLRKPRKRPGFMM
jgi:hypothetical protein